MTNPQPLDGRDIVILSPSEWGHNAVSNMQIAAHLSETNRVLYVETLGGRMPRFSEIGRVVARLRRALSGGKPRPQEKGLARRNVQLLSPVAIPVHGNRVIDFVNRHLLLAQVRRAMRRAGIGPHPVVWSFSPNWQAVAEALRPSVFVFHCVDALHTYDGSSIFRRRLEHTIRTADVVFTPGVLLERDLKPLNPNTIRIGHGCGADHLGEPGPCPADVAAIPAPRAVYAGELANWVDYDLLIALARLRPEVSLLLVGRLHALAPRDKVATLLSLSNVHHLGFRSYHELPAIYAASAVGLVPYDSANEHIRYSTPTKFLDYMAEGLPCISTRFPAAEDIGELITIVDDPASFAAAMAGAVQEIGAGAGDRRRAYARRHSWPAQISAMCAAISTCCQKAT